MMTAPMFYLPPDQVAGREVGKLLEVDGDEGRHAVAVKRLRVGERVLIGDGNGTVLHCAVERLVAKDSLFARVDRVQFVPVPTPHVTVVQALIKGDRMERALETLTEAGA
ncbi:MAG: 16S rRNA (uracil(1498)-N(3))-methyltransferase, partial [Actinobacteria bacterium]|nr:16S rRNA (uracil(1498)-N(3))-methyltransferase [Actinomycetota bacterium]